MKDRRDGGDQTARDHKAGQQQPAAPVRKREPNRHRGHRQVAATREAEQHRRNGHQQEDAAADAKLAARPMQEQARRHGDQRAKEQRESVGRGVDDDWRRLRDVIRVRAQRGDHQDRVGESDHDPGDTESRQDGERAPPRGHRVHEHEREGDRFDDIGAIQSEPRGPARGDQHGYRPREDEEQRRNRKRGAPLEGQVASPCFQCEDHDCEDDRGLQQRGRIKTVPPAHDVCRRQSAREGGDCDGGPVGSDLQESIDFSTRGAGRISECPSASGSSGRAPKTSSRCSKRRTACGRRWVRRRAGR